MATTPQAALSTAPTANGSSRKELSGSQWVPRFPTGTSINDLTPMFRRSVDDFIAAIQTAGGSVRISATYRPKERAYLMHYAAAIANGSITPERVPAMAGVDIEWNHGSTENLDRRLGRWQLLMKSSIRLHWYRAIPSEAPST